MQCVTANVSPEGESWHLRSKLRPKAFNTLCNYPSFKPFICLSLVTHNTDSIPSNGNTNGHDMRYTCHRILYNIDHITCWFILHPLKFSHSLTGREPFGGNSMTYGHTHKDSTMRSTDPIYFWPGTCSSLKR